MDHRFHHENLGEIKFPNPKGFRAWLVLTLLGVVNIGWAVNSLPPSPDSQGMIFIHEKIGDEKTFMTAFKDLREDFRSNGFLAYSLHRDLKNRSCLILTMQCARLSQGLAYLKTARYKNAMKKGGAKDPIVWSGADLTPRQYGELPPAPAGIVIARNELVSFVYWKAFYDAEHDPAHGGKNKNKQSGYHPERHYTASHYSIHRGLGKPDVTYVVHEASDVSKAPEFMNSPPMKAMKNPLGIKGFHVWYGYNLEQGIF